MINFIVTTFFITLGFFSVTANEVNRGQELKAIVAINTSVEKVSLGSTYDWQIIIAPWTNDLLKKEDILGDEFTPFIYITDVYNIDFSENNNEALVINVKAILAKDYRQPSLGYIQIENKKIPLRFDLPKNIETIEVDGSFTLMNRESPFRREYIKWVLLFLLAIGILILYGLKIRKKRVLIKKSFLYVARDYSDKGKLEKFYRERRSYEDLSGAKELIAEVERVQYRPDWEDYDKSHLINKLEEVFKEHA